MFSEEDIFPLMSKYPQFRFICGYPRQVADLKTILEIKDGVLYIKRGTPLEQLKEALMELCLHILLKHDEVPEGIKRDDVKVAVWHIAADEITRRYINALNGYGDISVSIYEIFTDLMQKLKKFPASASSAASSAMSSPSQSDQSQDSGGQSSEDPSSQSKKKRSSQGKKGKKPDAKKKETPKQSSEEDKEEEETDIEQSIRNLLSRQTSVEKLTHKFQDLEQIKKEVGTTIIEVSRMHLQSELCSHGYGMSKLQSEVKFRDYYTELPYILVNVFDTEDYIFKKPNKRYLTYNIYLPSLQSTVADLAVLLDISLSMSIAELEKALGALVTLLKFYEEYKVLFIEFSDGISRMKTFTNTDIGSLAQYRFKTGCRGGTDIRPVFQEIERMPQKPRAVIIFTDMEFVWPKKPSFADKIYWVMTKYKRSVEYGKVLHIV